MNHNPAIECRQLAKQFGQRSAVADVSFSVPQGVITALIGANGSGKTTTIRVLLGLAKPTAGSTAIFGFDSWQSGSAARQRCGALLESHGLYDALTAEANLDFYGRIWGLPAPERASRIAELLSAAGLTERRKDKVRGFSKGMKQKLALARATIHRPPLLILDEPTSGLDPLARVEFRNHLASLCREHGLSVLLATHDLTEAEQLAQAYVVLSEGRVLAAGTLSELRSQAFPSRQVSIDTSLIPPAIAEELGARCNVRFRPPAPFRRFASPPPPTRLPRSSRG